MIVDSVARFARSRWAVAFVAAWAFAEAIVFPVVPDVALLLLALAAPRRAPLLFASVVAGSLLGTAVLAWMAATWPLTVSQLVLAVPGIRPQMLTDASRAFAAGNVAPFAAIGPGTPLKVLTVAWLSAGGSPIALGLWVVVNRLTRIGPLLLLATAVGLIAPGWLRRHDRVVVSAYALAWVVTYFFYLS